MLVLVSRQQDVTWAVGHRTCSAERWEGDMSGKPSQQVDISGRHPAAQAGLWSTDTSVPRSLCVS